MSIFRFSYQVAVGGGRLNPRPPDYQADVLPPDHPAPHVLLREFEIARPKLLTDMQKHVSTLREKKLRIYHHTRSLLDADSPTGGDDDDILTAVYVD